MIYGQRPERSRPGNEVQGIVSSFGNVGETLELQKPLAESEKTHPHPFVWHSSFGTPLLVTWLKLKGSRERICRRVVPLRQLEKSFIVVPGFGQTKLSSLQVFN